MPIQITVTEVPSKLVTRDVIIPDKCPKCGADLTQVDALSANRYRLILTPCHIESPHREAWIEYDDGDKDEDTDELLVGFACNNCELDLTAKG